MSILFSRYRKTTVPKGLSTLQEEVKSEILDRINSGIYKFEGGPCCVCHGDRFTWISEVDSFGIPTPVYLCKTCGLLQTNPHFDEQSYGEFYQKNFFQLYKNMLSPTDEYLDSKKKSGEKIFKFLESQNLLPEKGALILEVGCGTGAGLSYFRDQGYQVIGCDLSREAIAKGREKYGISLHVGKLEDLELIQKPDLVIYCHVFEHIVDPYKELKMLKEILKSETMVYLEMPGLKKDFGNKLKFLKGAHVFHFSKQSLQNMLGKAGFSLIYGDEMIRSVFKFDPLIRYERKNDYVSSFYYLVRSEVTFRLKNLMKKV